jgi:hypothetical protein
MTAAFDFSAVNVVTPRHEQHAHQADANPCADDHSENECGRRHGVGPMSPVAISAAVMTAD